MSFRTTKLDFYDDKGALLRELVPLEHVPDFVKSAKVLSDDESSNLYALVLLEDGVPLKKFATADPGNSWLSALYFTKNRHLLPIEAQKTAATNIKQALEHHAIEVPSDIQKLASDGVEANYVDVTGKASPGIVRQSSEDIEYAIERADGSKKYPLNNAESVKTALSYFELKKGQFIPRERREYAVKVASVASKIGLPLNDAVAEYAGSEYSASLSGHLKLRKDYLDDAGAESLAKLASSRFSVEPHEFADELAVFDRDQGLDGLWDSMLLDPWRTTLAPLEKVAKGARATMSFQMGGDVVTESDLVRVSKMRNLIKENFGMEVANKFGENPVEIFSSMPLPQKKVLARLALEVAGSGDY